MYNHSFHIDVSGKRDCQQTALLLIAKIKEHFQQNDTPQLNKIVSHFSKIQEIQET